MAAHSSVLAWRTPGTGEPGVRVRVRLGLGPWGRTESGTTGATLQQQHQTRLPVTKGRGRAGRGRFIPGNTVRWALQIGVAKEG